MRKNLLFDDFDEFDEYTEQTRRQREKTKKRGGKGHQTKQDTVDQWNRLFGYDDIEEMNGCINCVRDISTAATVPQAPKPARPVQSTEPTKQPQQQRTTNITKLQNNTGSDVTTSGPIVKKPFVPTGTNTHTIRGNIIDFDRVDAIEKVESEYNGKHTYGIKFCFSGGRGSFRIAWFNQNMRERDSVFNSEYAYWYQIKNLDGNKK